jgi:hypothetical protein
MKNEMCCVTVSGTTFSASVSRSRLNRRSLRIAFEGILREPLLHTTSIMNCECMCTFRVLMCVYVFRIAHAHEVGAGCHFNVFANSSAQ